MPDDVATRTKQYLTWDTCGRTASIDAARKNFSGPHARAHMLMLVLVFGSWRAGIRIGGGCSPHCQCYAPALTTMDAFCLRVPKAVCRASRRPCADPRASRSVFEAPGHMLVWRLEHCDGHRGGSVRHRSGSRKPESVLSQPPVGRRGPTVSGPHPDPAPETHRLGYFQVWEGRAGRYVPGKGMEWCGLHRFAHINYVPHRLSPRGAPRNTSWGPGSGCPV